MTPDDPRHGKSAGYCAGCHDECCRTAIATYSRDLRARQYLAGGPLVVDATGTKRRIRALMALGWTGRQIDVQLDRKPTYTANLLCGPDRVNRDTAARVAAVYDRMSMRLPEHQPDANLQVITRTRGYARRKGWAPPLAWDDIDHDPAPVKKGRDSRPADSIDHAVVERMMAGGERPGRKLTTAESTEIVRRALARGMSFGDIEDVYGIKAERFTKAGAAA